jgi:hypothetical protein
MVEQGLPNSIKLGLWVHQYKLIGNVCRALATSDWGRSFLNKFVFTREYRGLEETMPAILLQQYLSCCPFLSIPCYAEILHNCSCVAHI